MKSSRDTLEEFIRYKLGWKGKTILIILLNVLWLKYSSDLFFMIKFFGFMIIVSIVLTIYELIFYKKIYKK